MGFLEQSTVTVIFDSPKEAYDAFEPVDYDIPGPGCDEIQNEMTRIMHEDQLSSLKDDMATFLDVGSYGLSLYEHGTYTHAVYGTDCDITVNKINRDRPPQNARFVEIKATDIMTVDQIAKTIRLLDNHLNK